MAKDIDINSKEWCDIVFEGKNKSYGAYRMRLTSSKRHVRAFFIVLLFFSFIAALPFLIDRIEYYLFQHSDSDYVIEDYSYITHNLTEVELLQLSKQFIPDPTKTVVKTTSTEKPKPLAKNVESLIPVIVADSLIKETYIEKYEEDTTPVKESEKPEEKVETETDDGLYTVIDNMPAFPGGEAGLMDYIYKNLRYPSAVANKKIENCVICTFIIDIKGNVTDAQITQSAHPLLDKEALRLVKTFPKWKPGMLHGKPIRVKYTLPIFFRLK